MKKELISRLHRSFEEAAYEENGVEYWLARDLQKMLDYNERNFFKKLLKRLRQLALVPGRGSR